ncbi:MAG: NAD(P)H-dependent glycerol-3-phosphate dehydrogenase [Candidatus Omnitrophota bacterium]
MKIAVLGDGGWGTTLAIMLSKKGFNVTVWGAFPDYISLLQKKRVNTRFLAGIRIPEEVKFTACLEEATEGKELIIFAIPSQYLRRVLKQLSFRKPLPGVYYLSVSKGIEVGTLKRMSEVIHDELGRIKLGVLSGPTIAQEVARGIPTAAVIASYDKKTRVHLQGIFASERFRIYTNDDVVGVELGGSLKNIIAIACGISDGLRFGANTKAALLARGLAEISRLGCAMGARQKTFSGVSGLGDLVTTCISPFSRNRFVGEQIGRGKQLRQIEKKMAMVAEGVPTTKSACKLSLRHKVDMPIAREVYNVLYKNKPPLTAVRDLMGRDYKEE